MALSRAEIELLIKARNDAQGAFDSLNKQVKQVTGETEHATEEMTKFGKATDGAGKSGVAAGVVLGNLATGVMRGIKSAFQDSIDAANRLDSGLIGLGATAKAFHTDAESAQIAAQKLASDGLMTVGDAATGLKNLLAAGFGLDQAVVLMNRFKDSAAFGRQGALKFGEAIVGATEGIKNGNSALVDNAGVTKNLSVILSEAGMSANDLQKAQSDVNVRTAIYNGILKETNPQLGNTALYLDTAAGKQAKFNSQIEIAEQKIGKQLQPVLSDMLGILTPVVDVIGKMAPVLVPATVAVVGIVGPLLAMKAAAALGIPAIGGLTREMLSAVSIFGGVRSFADSRAAIQLVGEAAGITTKNLGTLGTAASIAGAAMAGWQIGRMIDQLSEAAGITGGLSGQIQNFTEKYGYAISVMSGMPIEWLRQAGQSKQLTEQLQKETIARAEQAGVVLKQQDASAKYLEAAKALQNLEIIRQGTFNKSVAMQRQVLQAEIDLGRVSQEQANLRKAAIDVEEHAQQVAKNRISLADSIKLAEQAVQKDIKATGLTTAELEKQLRTNEDAFKAWATTVGLSDKTIKFLEDDLKKHTAAQKDSTEEAKKAEQAQQKLRDVLEKANIITLQQARQEYLQWKEAVVLAVKEGVPFVNVLEQMIPKLDELRIKAKASGLAVEGMAADIEAGRQELLKGIGPLTQSTAQLVDVMGRLPGAVQLAARDQVILDAALKTTGQKTLPELTRAAQEAERAYHDIATQLGERSPQAMEAYQRMVKVQIEATTNGATAQRLALQSVAHEAELTYQNIVAAVGKNAPEAKKAYQDMVDAQLKATGQIPSFWQANVFPGIRQTVQQIGTAVEGSFAQMILGAKGFGDGFTDIWKSIKAGVLNVMNEILSAFVNQFVKGMLASLSGQRGAFTQAFGTLLGGASSATGGGQGVLSGLLGGGVGGGRGFVAGGPDDPMVGMGHGVGAGALIGGGVTAIGGGLALYAALKQKSKLGSTLAGAQTGAGIGTMILPGIGTAIGAGVGALGGFVASLFGGGAGKKANDFRDDFKGHFGDAGGVGLDKAISGATAGPTGLKGADAQALASAYSVFLSSGNVDTIKKAITDITALLDKQTKQTDALAQATNKWGLSWKDMDQATQQSSITKAAKDLLKYTQDLEAAGYRHEAVLKAQAKAYSELVQNALQMGVQIPPGIKSVIDELVRMGLLVDENGDKYEFNADSIEQTQKDMADTLARISAATTEDEKAEQMKRLKDLEEKLQRQRHDYDEYKEHLFGVFDDVADKAKNTPVTIPVRYDVEQPPGRQTANGGDWPGPDQGGPEGAAASGVMATRPGLVIFGEGNEPELGGPKSFFRDVLKSLGVGSAGVGGGPVINFQPGSIQVLDATGLEDAVQRRIIPMITNAISGNKRGARTNFRAAIGVT